MTRDKIIAEVIGIESGYSNHPDDPGGRTIYGISETHHPEMWEDGPPTPAQAVLFYAEDFWEPLRCDDFDSAKIAAELFEASVLSGRHTATGWLQTAYNQICPPEWLRLEVDGMVGPYTLRAINHMCERYEAALYNGMNTLQGAYLMRTEKRTFVRGWLAKRIRTMKA
jgi:lysozyme family protein